MIRVRGPRRFASPLGDRIGSARSPQVAREGLVIELVDEATGLRGLGEASPLPGTSVESIDEAMAALRELEPLLVAASGLSGADLSSLDPDRAVDVVSGLGAVAELPSARFAVETALSDLAARAQRRSLASWLSGGSARAAPIERSVLLGAIDGPELFERARRELARGARTFKLKVDGRDPKREADALRELREALSPATVALRVDLNGGLDLEAARDAVSAYAEAGVELVEEPTRGVALLGLGRCAAPWFADESLAHESLRERLLSDPSCAGFVIKPTLLGLFGARRLAVDAMRAGKGIVVTHTFDGPIALAAACELALSLPGEVRASGLDRHAALGVFPALAIPQLPEARPGKQLSIVNAGVLGLGLDGELA